MRRGGASSLFLGGVGGGGGGGGAVLVLSRGLLCLLVKFAGLSGNSSLGSSRHLISFDQ